MTAQMAAQDADKASPWHVAYPTSKTAASSISKEEFLQLLKSGAVPGKDILLVDLRRNDHEGGTIRGSINLPAQSLFPSIATIYQLVKVAGVKRVLWYCGEIVHVLGVASNKLQLTIPQGSSRGRGPRAAAWFADHLATVQESGVQCLILEGGIKGWVQGRPDFIDWMDKHDESQWSGTVT